MVKTTVQKIINYHHIYTYTLDCKRKKYIQIIKKQLQKNRAKIDSSIAHNSIAAFEVKKVLSNYISMQFSINQTGDTPHIKINTDLKDEKYISFLYSNSQVVRIDVLYWCV